MRSRESRVEFVTTMGFRNDADAILARAEALERENKLLRQKIAEREDLDDVEAENKQLHDELEKLKAKADDKKAAEQRKKAKAKAKAAKRTAKKLKRDNRKLKQTLGEGASAVLTIGAIMFAIALLLALVIKCNKAASKRVVLGKQQVRYSLITKHTSGPAIASVLYTQQRSKRRGRTRWSMPGIVRLTTIDLTTGKRGNTITLYEATKRKSASEYVLFAPAGNLSWAKHPVEGLQLVDILTPHVVLTSAEIKAKVKGLGSYRVTGAHGRVAVLLLESGEYKKVDMAEVVGDPPPAPPDPIKRRRCRTQKYEGYSCRAKRCITMPKLNNSTARRLDYGPVTTGPDAVDEANPAKPSALIRPHFVWDKTRSGCVFETDAGVVISHATSAFGRSKKQVSLVNRRGVIEWTQPIHIATYRSRGGFEHEGAIYIFGEGSDKSGVYYRVTNRAMTQRKLLDR